MLQFVNASIITGIFPARLKEGVTLVIPKLDKETYAAPNAYRPITLLNCLGKIVETVINRRLQHHLELFNVLPPTHFGFRKNFSCEVATLVLTEDIRHGWEQEEMTSAVFLDVKGAYDTVIHGKLLHLMYQYGLRKLLKGENDLPTMGDFSRSQLHSYTGSSAGKPTEPNSLYCL
jgi:hypothetical protein